MRLLVIALSLFLFSGCYRTHYVNFSQHNPQRATSSSESDASDGWQSFFLYGWLPGERRVDARRWCGGEENIDSIKTRKTFLQGLVTQVAGYYINIYAPWDGEIHCVEKPSIP